MNLDSLTTLDKELLLALNGSQSVFLDSVVKTLTATATWIPLYVSMLYVVLKNSDTMRRVLTIVCCAAVCVLLAGTIDDTLVKPLVARWRPARDGEIGVLVDIVNGYRGGRFGFFSAHASNTFSIAVFFSLLVRNRTFTITMVTWSLLNCWTRLYLGVHYPGDIVCGLLWGALVGTGVWYAYHRLVPKGQTPPNFISSQYTSTGFQRSQLDAVTTVFILTIIFAFIKACF